jgi:hypothetical protein
MSTEENVEFEEANHWRCEVGATDGGGEEDEEVEQFLGGHSACAPQRRRLHLLELSRDAHHQLDQTHQRQQEEHRRERRVVAEVRRPTNFALKSNLDTPKSKLIKRLQLLLI